MRRLQIERTILFKIFLPIFPSPRDVISTGVDDAFDSFLRYIREHYSGSGREGSP